MNEPTQRDLALLPVTRAILNDIVVNGNGTPISYTKFAKRATRLSGLPVIPRHTGRMLDLYWASRVSREEDLSNLVVSELTGEPKTAKPDRREEFRRYFQPIAELHEAEAAR